MAHCGVVFCEAPKQVAVLVTTSSAIPVPCCGDSSHEGVYFNVGRLEHLLL